MTPTLCIGRWFDSFIFSTRQRVQYLHRGQQRRGTALLETPPTWTDLFQTGPRETGLPQEAETDELVIRSH